MAMRAVDDNAEGLKPTVPAKVHSELTTLMRWLIDNTYDLTAASPPDWDAEITHTVLTASSPECALT